MDEKMGQRFIELINKITAKDLGNMIIYALLFIVIIIIILVVVSFSKKKSKWRRQQRNYYQQMQQPRQQYSTPIKQTSTVPLTREEIQSMIDKSIEEKLKALLKNEYDIASKEQLSLEERNLAKGKKAEESVSSYIKRTIEKHNKNAYIFNQCEMTSSINDLKYRADHIVIGTFGIIIVETKSLEGRIYGDINDSEWLKVYADNFGKVYKAYYDKNYINQLNEYESTLKEVLCASGFENPNINSFLVFKDTKNHDESNEKFRCMLNKNCMDNIKFLDRQKDNVLGDTVAHIINSENVLKSDEVLFIKSILEQHSEEIIAI